MAIIGPRPLLVRYLARYNEEQHHRHDVRPGLTGYAQAHGRNAVSWEDKFAMDVWYTTHITFAGDIEEEKVNVCKAIQGIEERGRAEGIQHEQKLTKSLLKDNRIDDLKRALDDPALRQKLLEEYGID